MKIKVLGKEHKSGTSKKNGKPYDFNVLYYTAPRFGVEGISSESALIPPDAISLADIVIGKDYEVDYDGRGYFVGIRAL